MSCHSTDRIARVGVVADDVTGSNDIGIMYTKAGLRVNILSHAAYEKELACHSDVIIIDTDSRFTRKEDAYQRVYTATKQLKTLGVNHFFKKTCSVFRGHIGVEFDAMLDALNEEFAVVVVGFPDNGRMTRHATHYVNHVRLEDSEFKNDPMNPMQKSNLIDILKEQTKRNVGAIYYEELDKGWRHIKEQLDDMRREYHYVIMDVRDNKDLETIAMAAKDIKVVGGASAVAGELGKYVTSRHRTGLPVPAIKPGLGIVSIAGSLTPQTRSQIQYAKEQGVLTMEMKTPLIFHRDKIAPHKKQLVQHAVEAVHAGTDVLIYTSNTNDIIQKTKETGKRQGMEEDEISRLVSSTLADIAREIMCRTGQNRMLVAGGDTSGSFCKALNIKGMSVYKEIAPGLPSCISLPEPEYMLVLKSGGFGGPEFFIDAYNHLKTMHE